MPSIVVSPVFECLFAAVVDCMSVCIAQNGTVGDDRFTAAEMGSDGSSVLAGNVNGWFWQYTGSILNVCFETGGMLS